MSVINSATKEIHCKIVYYGTSLSGKTTNLAYIHAQVPAEAKGELVTLSDEADGDLFYDFLPLNLGTIRGHRVRFHLYTVPGQLSQEKTRMTLLNGVDGVVFVADSSRSRFRDNVRSFNEMQHILSALGKPVDHIPLVMQFNKQDLADAVPVPILNARINSVNAPFLAATANKGVGVLPTLRAISELVVGRLE